MKLREGGNVNPTACSEVALHLFLLNRDFQTPRCRNNRISVQVLAALSPSDKERLRDELADFVDEDISGFPITYVPLLHTRSTETPLITVRRFNVCATVGFSLPSFTSSVYPSLT